MEDLFGPFLDRPAQAGVVTDFDGTLAPIVDDPAAARPLPEAVEVLHALARRYGRVAVVSGRPAAFLARHLDLAARPPGLLAVGLYGLETADGDGVTADPRALEWVPAIERVAALAEEEAPAGVILERKGLSLVIHYRTSPAAGEWVTAWAAGQAAATGLARHPARMSEELRPPVAVDKGTVVGRLAAGLAAVCFLGDDVGDLPAFAALDEAASGGAAAVRVGVRSDEAPAALLDAADVVVDGPEGAVALLRSLLG